MATSTIEDIVVTGTDWVEVFTASGVSSGSNIVVQNKGSSSILIQTNTSNVAPTNMSGYLLESGKSAKITAESYVFMKSGCSDCRVHLEIA